MNVMGENRGAQRRRDFCGVCFLNFSFVLGYS